jgi:cytochrome c
MTLAFRLAAIAAAAALALPAAASAQTATGKRLFLQCQACHTVKKGEPHKIGPNLNGVFGAKAGSRAGYRYSPAMAKSPIVWTEATLDRLLQRPVTAVPGTKMIFGGMARKEDRAALIAYLKTVTR